MAKTYGEGNLSIDNSEGWNRYYGRGGPRNYPAYKFVKKEDDGSKLVSFLTGSIEICPLGFTPELIANTEDEDFEQYVKSLEEEFKDLADDKMQEASPFIGNKRNARWHDERRRRGIGRGVDW